METWISGADFKFKTPVRSERLRLGGENVRSPINTRRRTTLAGKQVGPLVVLSADEDSSPPIKALQSRRFYKSTVKTSGSSNSVTTTEQVVQEVRNVVSAKKSPCLSPKPRGRPRKSIAVMSSTVSISNSSFLTEDNMASASIKQVSAKSKLARRKTSPVKTTAASRSRASNSKIEVSPVKSESALSSASNTSAKSLTVPTKAARRSTSKSQVLSSASKTSSLSSSKTRLTRGRKLAVLSEDTKVQHSPSSPTKSPSKAHVSSMAKSSDQKSPSPQRKARTTKRKSKSPSPQRKGKTTKRKSKSPSPQRKGKTTKRKSKSPSPQRKGKTTKRKSNSPSPQRKARTTKRKSKTPSPQRKTRTPQQRIKTAQQTRFGAPHISPVKLAVSSPDISTSVNKPIVVSEAKELKEESMTSVVDLSQKKSRSPVKSLSSSSKIKAKSPTNQTSSRSSRVSKSSSSSSMKASSELFLSATQLSASAGVKTKSPDKPNTRSPAKAHTKSPARVKALSPAKANTKSPARVKALSPDKANTRSPARVKALSPATRVKAKSPARLQTKSLARIKTKSALEVKNSSAARGRKSVAKSASPVKDMSAHIEEIMEVKSAITNMKGISTGVLAKKPATSMPTNSAPSPKRPTKKKVPFVSPQGPHISSIKQKSTSKISKPRKSQKSVAVSRRSVPNPAITTDLAEKEQLSVVVSRRRSAPGITAKPAAKTTTRKRTSATRSEASPRKVTRKSVRKATPNRVSQFRSAEEMNYSMGDNSLLFWTPGGQAETAMAGNTPFHTPMAGRVTKEVVKRSSLLLDDTIVSSTNASVLSEEECLSDSQLSEDGHRDAGDAPSAAKSWCSIM